MSEHSTWQAPDWKARFPGRLLSHDPTLQAEGNPDSASFARVQQFDAVTTESRDAHAKLARSDDPAPVAGDAGHGTDVARPGFAPPAPGTRAGLIVGGLRTNTRVDLGERVTDELVSGAAPVVPGVDEAPTRDDERDEAQAAGVHVDEASQESVSRATRVDDEADCVGDDFWSGATQEGSVPTRKLVSGTHPIGRRQRWLVKSFRRR